jgi:YgiT-type zinc finger domain-containing protein
MPEMCCICAGKLKRGKTDFHAKVNGEMITITGVPALICGKCGEKYLEPKTSRKIDDVVRKLAEGKLSYHHATAREIELPA